MKIESIDSFRRRALARGIATMTAFSTLMGCSMLTPYDHRSIEVALKESDPPSRLRLAGGTAEALLLAEEMRQQYFDNLRFTSLVRSTTAVTAVALSGWALYNAFKPNGDTVPVGDTRRSVRLGVGLGTLYALRQLFVNPDDESIWAEGYKSVTCLMLQSGPLLLTETNPLTPSTAPALAPRAASDSALTDESPDRAAVLSPRYTVDAGGDLDRLRRALDELEAWMLFVNRRTSILEAKADALAGDDQAIKNAQMSLRSRIVNARKALGYGRNALVDGRTLVRTIEGAGRDIKDRVGIITAVVNQEVQAKQHDIGKASDLLKDAHDITSSVMNIGSATAADQANVAAADVAQSLAPRATPVTFGSLRLGSAAAAGSALFGMAGAQTLGLLPGAQVATAVAAQAASSSPSAPSPAASQPAKKKTVAPAKPVEPKNAIPTSADLQKIRDLLDAQIKALTSQEEANRQKALVKTQQEELDKLDAKVRPAAARATSDDKICGTSKNGCAADLADDTEHLYAARRPVVQELLNFRAKARATNATPECAELAVLRVTPNDVVRARPGDTVSYIVSQRAAGSPLAIMLGPTDAAKGAKFEFLPVQGTTFYTAKVQIGADMPPQTIKLVISDSKGIASQSLSIVTGARLAALPADPAASDSAAGKPKDAPVAPASAASAVPPAASPAASAVDATKPASSAGAVPPKKSKTK